ncbi:MAG: 50S ribosomal protein L12 [Candidatus Pacearchaeota archaeon]
MEYIYAALLLHKLGKTIDEKGIIEVIKATGASVDETKVKNLVASLKGVDIDTEIANATAMNFSAIQVSSSSSGIKAEESPKEEKKTAEESAAGLSALFG